MSILGKLEENAIELGTVEAPEAMHAHCNPQDSGKVRRVGGRAEHGFVEVVCLHAVSVLDFGHAKDRACLSIGERREDDLVSLAKG